MNKHGWLAVAVVVVQGVAMAQNAQAIQCKLNASIGELTFSGTPATGAMATLIVNSGTGIPINFAIPSLYINKSPYYPGQTVVTALALVPFTISTTCSASFAWMIQVVLNTSGIVTQGQISTYASGQNWGLSCSLPPSIPVTGLCVN